MIIHSVTDAAFGPYGRVVEGLDTAGVQAALAATELPETGTAYVPRDQRLHDAPGAGALCASLFGGMPVQLGWCNGRNTKLNCLEYHRDSEFNLGCRDFILLVARRDEVENGVLDTARVKAFRVPAGVLVEVYATTLHYAPCHTDGGAGFRVMVALPAGTNTAKPDLTPATAEDRMLEACNKWLLAHPQSPAAAGGAYIGLRGDNIDLAETI